MKGNKIFLPFLFAFVATSSCVQTSTQEKLQTSLTLELKELHPGILEGYLSEEELSNSLFLVSSPPKEGSAAYALDQDMAAMCGNGRRRTKNPDCQRCQFELPEATEAFNIILNTNISKETTPNLYMILCRTLADAGLSAYAAINHYQRNRHFMVNNTPICTPEEEEGLRKDGSYPSGHTAVGWVWALKLGEVFPEQSDVILEHGKEFGGSRNVRNVYWYSDVLAGRMMGAATVAKLHTSKQFMIDLAAAKQGLNRNY